jgi:hypothetical protein
MGSFLMYSPCSVPSGFAEIVKNKEGQWSPEVPIPTLIRIL